MAVVIRPNFSKSDIQKMVAERVGRIEQVIFRNLQKIGEDFITHARNNDTYKDRTGNLRSSTGYVILHNGEQVFGSTFDQVIGPESQSSLKLKRKTGLQEDTSGNIQANDAGLQVDSAAPVPEKSGSETGRTLIEELKKKFPRGFVLIGVAGMDYAASVEAKGYDVITASSTEAAASLKTAMERIAKIAIA